MEDFLASRTTCTLNTSSFSPQLVRPVNERFRDIRTSRRRLFIFAADVDVTYLNEVASRNEKLRLSDKYTENLLLFYVQN